jgi:hypothetical protein
MVVDIATLAVQPRFELALLRGSIPLLLSKKGLLERSLPILLLRRIRVRSFITTFQRICADD